MGKDECKEEFMNEVEEKLGKKERWHVGKEIPIATILALLLQTGGVVWLAASTVAKVEFLEKQLINEKAIQLITDKRQDEDNDKMELRIMKVLERLEIKIDKVIEHKERK